MDSPVAVRRFALVPEEALGLKILADSDGMPAHVRRGLVHVHPGGIDVLSHASALYGHPTTAAELSVSWCFLGLDTSLRSAESPSSHCDLLGVPWREGRQHLLEMCCILFGPTATLRQGWSSHVESLHFRCGPRRGVSKLDTTEPGLD